MIDFDMSDFERDPTQPKFVPGDTIFAWGKIDLPGWDFIGIKNTGISYRVITGQEGPVEVRYLVRLLTK